LDRVMDTLQKYGFTFIFLVFDLSFAAQTTV
jgi:hypothetical protein